MQWFSFLGAPLLLIWSLFDLGSHKLEQKRRHQVLIEGKEAQAVVRPPSGLQWVTIEWQDTAGRPRDGTGWTGKPFARRIREYRGVTETVEIKYLDDPAINPVILSEAPERERVNKWWIYTDMGMSTAMSILLGWSAFTFLWWRSAKRGDLE